MGFTRYFDIKNKLNKSTFHEFSKASKEITSYVSQEINHRISGPIGEGDPIFEKDEVTFNGYRKNSHETFTIRSDSFGFNFVKTVHKPYDKHVFAVLELAKIYFKDSIWVYSDSTSTLNRSGISTEYPQIYEYVVKFIRDKKINNIIESGNSKI